MLTPLHRVIIYVGDVQKCAGFFRATFGFTVLPSDHTSTEWIELDTGGRLLVAREPLGRDPGR